MMNLETLLVQIPHTQDGSPLRKAVVMNQLCQRQRDANMHTRKAYADPQFVIFEQLSEADQKLWEAFIEMIERNVNANLTCKPKEK